MKLNQFAVRAKNSFAKSAITRWSVLSKRQFFIRYILIFNIYGTLLVTFSILTFLVSIHIFKTFSVLIVIFSIAVLYSGLRVSMGYKKKYKYYFITQKKIERNGFDDEYFKWGFIEPCYRILTRYILMENNRGSDYKRLLKIFNTSKKVKNYIENKMIEDALKIKWD